MLGCEGWTSGGAAGDLSDKTSVDVTVTATAGVFSAAASTVA